MTGSARDVLNIAQKWIGYKESPAGSNRSHFGSWYGVDGVPWCAMFVSFCLFSADVKLNIESPKGFKYCPYGVSWFKKQGKWKTNNPQPGDVVFFDWVMNGIPEAFHVGFVESVNANGTINTIEGNTGATNASNGGQVMRCIRHPKFILGYGTPPYGKSDGTSPTRNYPNYPGRYMTLTSPLMTGADIETMKKRMVERGWKFKGKLDTYDSETEGKVRLFQAEKGLEVDGVVGPLAWTYLWESPIT